MLLRRLLLMSVLQDVGAELREWKMQVCMIILGMPCIPWLYSCAHARAKSRPITLMLSECVGWVLHLRVGEG